MGLGMEELYPLVGISLVCAELLGISLEDLVKKKLPNCEDNEEDLEIEFGFDEKFALSIEAFWNFCLEITNLGSTVSTLGEEITLESIADTLLGISPELSSQEEDTDEPALPFPEELPLLELGTE